MRGSREAGADARHLGSGRPVKAAAGLLLFRTSAAVVEAVLLAAILAGPAWGEGDSSLLEDRIAAVVRSSEPPAEIAVIRVYHAKAEELAVTLRRILPPDVTVVPDVPTNSLIVSVPSASRAQPAAPR